MKYIDTHTHIDGTEFDADRAEVISRAKAAGVTKMFVPAIDLKSVDTVLRVCRDNSGFAYPMIGLHPEEVKEDWQEQLHAMRQMLQDSHPFIAIGEVGLDYYWSREYADEQLEAFEEQVKWSIETRLPLMIHCRKAQNEMVALLRKYKDQLPGGVFHCFTGNVHEAEELMTFPRFVLGIGGVSTFKSSHLREDLPAAVPLDRIVLETDSPYMAPVPLRGQRNESAFLPHVIKTLAASYGVSEDEVAQTTTRTALAVFPLARD
ncbi:MAG: TatD family hydrolase [Prevotella sp.]|nr:TatD family hydrolase [Prevotella sp.]MDY5946768.1 TatD family hydrolase [Prevotella sp.]